MTKLFKYIFLIGVLSLFNCQTQNDIDIKLQEKIASFNIEDFPNKKFERFYKLEGQYNTRKDFEILLPKIEIHRGSEKEVFEDFLIFNKDGTVDSFYDKNLESAKLRVANKKNSYFGVINKSKAKNYIVVQQAFKGIMRLGISPSYGIEKIQFKAVAEKIYLQEGNKCSIYTLCLIN